MIEIFSQSITFVIGLIIEIYKITGNLGVAIIAFTVLIRLILTPLTLPSIQAQKKMRDVKPELDSLKKKHGKDKQKFQQAQMALYKKYNINPLAGCIPQLLQIVVLIVLYQAIIRFLKQPTIDGVTVNLEFFWLHLGQPDHSFILPILAAGTQLVLSLMIAPGAEQPDLVENNSKNKKVQNANKKEEDFAEMAASMQQQMLFMMPIMTGVIAYQFPSGLALYWVVTTVFSIMQQYIVSGPGGLVEYVQRAWHKFEMITKK